MHRSELLPHWLEREKGGIPGGDFLDNARWCDPRISNALFERPSNHITDAGVRLAARVLHRKASPLVPSRLTELFRMTEQVNRHVVRALWTAGSHSTCSFGTVRVRLPRGIFVRRRPARRRLCKRCVLA